ncbi:hypothetical protein ACZ90_18270 [Streptomyces albus subsp. albus]|nr:hypothetical protein ACZ90_18270 [Streptomyces albus subsp. albus]
MRKVAGARHGWHEHISTPGELAVVAAVFALLAGYPAAQVRIPVERLTVTTVRRARGGDGTLPESWHIAELDDAGRPVRLADTPVDPTRIIRELIPANAPAGSGPAQAAPVRRRQIHLPWVRGAGIDSRSWTKWSYSSTPAVR